MNVTLSSQTEEPAVVPQLELQCWVCNKRTAHEDLGWSYGPSKRYKCKVCGANSVDEEEDNALFVFYANNGSFDP